VNSTESGTWKKMVDVVCRAMRTTQPPQHVAPIASGCERDLRHRMPREYVEDHLALLLAAGY
jgi:hypothetical protein